MGFRGTGSLECRKKIRREIVADVEEDEFAPALGTKEGQLSSKTHAGPGYEDGVGWGERVTLGSVGRIYQE